jgi:hypothetical protein
MGTMLISKIREEYPDRIMNSFSVAPSPKVLFAFPHISANKLRVAFFAFDGRRYADCSKYFLSTEHLQLFLKANPVVDGPPGWWPSCGQL